jgi:uncharacterized protein YodC (DUF2158 family)
MEEFKIGDIVQLKSGGPKMTVQRVIGSNNNHIGLKATDEFYKIKGFEEGDLICQWFVGNSLKDGTFSAKSLIKL